MQSVPLITFERTLPGPISSAQYQCEETCHEEDQFASLVTGYERRR